jgi:hypothetical protein
VSTGEHAERDEQVNNDHLPDHIYARGYTISLSTTHPPRASWTSGWVGGVYVTRDPRVPVLTAKGPSHFVTVVGMIWDVMLEDGTSQDAVNDLLASLTVSSEAFFDKLDQMSGRFVVAYGTAESVTVCGDATVMKSIIYSAHHPGIVASHVEIVARIAKASRSPVTESVMAHPNWKMPKSRYLPGSITEWEGVHYLTANTALCLNDGKISRFWPRQAISQMAVDEAVDLVSDLMHREMAWLLSQGRPLVTSLTAGIDSRMAFSISASYPQIVYFTYSDGQSEAHRADAEVAEEMAEELSLPHEVLPIDKSEGRSTVNQIKINNRISHLPFAASAYLRRFPQNTIHVRSNLAEIGRVFYRNQFKKNRADAAEMAKAWRGMSEEPAAVAAFQQWMEHVDFNETLNAEMGLEAADLFYWEHRMSCWHGRVVCESDIAFDTTSLFNNRKILVALLSVSREQRVNAEIFLRVIKKNAPNLLRWPINGAPLT